MSPPLVFVVTATPGTANHPMPPHARLQYQHAARQEQARQLGGAQLEGRLYVRIVWLHNVPHLIHLADTDNAAKRVIDALKGVVYADDRIIDKIAVHRLDAASASDAQLSVRGDVELRVVDRMRVLRGQPHLHIVYVEIGVLDNLTVTLGPIDR
jgi:Holliday junction resolvase RusA-like endonuclease